MTDTIRASRGQLLWRTIRDLVWPTLDEGPQNTAAPERSVPDRLSADTLKVVHQQLTDELATEVERKKIVEGKLATIVALTPVPVTILLAVVTFLSSGRAEEFTDGSVITLSICAFLVALQFLRALLAAIRGLSRMEYWAPRTSIPAAGTTIEPHSSDACNDLLRRIETYRSNANEKVSQLALAHESIRNAVIYLMLAIGALSFVTAWGR